MFDSVLNMTLDYWSCIAVAQRVMYGNTDICQNYHSIPSKLEFSSYSEVIHRNGGEISINSDTELNISSVLCLWKHTAKLKSKVYFLKNALKTITEEVERGKNKFNSNVIKEIKYTIIFSPIS